MHTLLFVVRGQHVNVLRLSVSAAVSQHLQNPPAGQTHPPFQRRMPGPISTALQRHKTQEALFSELDSLSPEQRADLQEWHWRPYKQNCAEMANHFVRNMLQTSERTQRAVTNSACV